MFRESLRMSWQNIIHNKMRSFLTILGVLIGVASIIALISIIEGVTASITGDVMELGGDRIMVQAKGTPLKRGLTLNDIDSISDIDNVKGVSPTVNGKSSVVYNGKVLSDITVQGKNHIYFKNTEDLIENGRIIYKLDVDNRNRVCLIGRNIADELFPAENPIDRDIMINGITYTVIGTLKESSGFAAGSNDNTVIVPFTSAMGLLGTGYVSSIDVYMDDSDFAGSTAADIEKVLNTAFNYNEDGFSVTSMQNILDRVEEMTATMTLMLAAIASIALFVGGIGIMNMMLVSVTERTVEIGLRKALGAEPKTIRTQFLLEALFLSVFGGILGLIAGILVAFLFSLILETTFMVAVYSISLAIGFSVAVGMVFGYAPARKASRLNPIDALRSV